MSPTMTSGLRPASFSASAPPSTPIRTGLNSRTYGRTMRRSRLWPGPARDDERVTVAEARLERRKVDPLREQAPLVAQVAHGVVGEFLAAPPSRGRAGRPAPSSSSSAPSVRPEASCVPFENSMRAAHREPVAVAHLVEQVGAGSVDQPDSSAHERERAGIGESARLRLRDVDDDADTGLDQLLRRDAVEVGVVDDRDVVRARAGARDASSAGRAARSRELDEAVHRSGERNSCPPSIRSSSSRRWSASRLSIVVCVGSPGTFSTRKWPLGQARDLREVRDRDHLRALGEAAQRLRRRRARSARRCPRRSRRRSSCARRRRPRSRARSARARLRTPSRRPGANGSPRLGRIRNGRPVGAGRLRARLSASSARNSPSPIPIPWSSAATASANGAAAAAARRAQLAASSSVRRSASATSSAAAAAGSTPSSSALSSARAACARSSSSA